MKRSLLTLVFAVLIALPAATSAQSNQPSYRYNRVSVEYHIERDGSVRVRELLTMLYNGTYHLMWVGIPVATSTVVSDIRVFDGATGQPFTLTTESFLAEEPQSWGKYHVESDATAGRTNVEWYYSVNDRVHTWVLEYTLRGVIALYGDHDEFSWDIFANYDVPVDTVESQVFLPAPVTQPQARIATTGNHDWYVDRPDNKTFRFRVSDITPGERVSLQVGWQKGLVVPKLAVPFTWRPHVRYVIAGAVLLMVLVSGYILVRFRREVMRSTRLLMRPVAQSSVVTYWKIHRFISEQVRKIRSRY